MKNDSLRWWIIGLVNGFALGASTMLILSGLGVL